MTEQTPTTPAASDPNAPENTPGGPGAASAVTTPPPGFVSVEELERERQRSRTFQSELDRVKATIAAAPAETASGKTTEPGLGFDPDAFLDRVYGATALVTQADKIRAEFPHADPSLFEAKTLKQFGSVDALRIAAEADHRRVESVITAQRESIEAEVMKKYNITPAAPEPPVGGPPSGTAPATGSGVPTAAQLAGMSIDQLIAFEKSNPGVAEAVLLGSPQ